MKKLLLTILVTVFCLQMLHAQVGVGTEAPDKSSQLDVVSADKGILIPRVALNSTTDKTTIKNGNINSLLVFNTNTKENITPGYYYWYVDKWFKMAATADIFEDIITTLIKEEGGTFTYTSENNTKTVIDIPAAVVQNILDKGEVYTQILKLVDFYEKVTSLRDNGNGSYTFYSESDIDDKGYIVNGGVTFSVINDVVTNIQQEGAIYNEIINILNAESDILTDNGNGTYTHTAVDGTPIIIDANTTKVTVKDGIYTFTDAKGDVITSIDTNSDAVAYDNADSSLNSDNVKDALDELANTISTTKGELTIAGGLEFTGGATGVDKLLADAGIQIADKGISTEKLADKAVTSDKLDGGDGDEGRVGVADAAGNITYTTLDEVVKANETVTILVKNAGGTYTYYNEKEVDKDGNPIAGSTGVTIDPKEVSVALNTTTNIYEFKDSSGAVIGSIDMNASKVAFDNSTNGFTSNNVQGALEGLLASIEANKGNLSVAGGLEFTGATTGVDKLLADAGIQIADKGISTEKLADKAVTSDKLDGGDGDEGRVGVADAAGNITYTTLDEVVKANETVTILVKNAGGTYTYYNEKEVDKDGNPIAGSTGVTIDPKEVSVALNSTTNIYEFKDSSGAVIGSIDMNASKVAFDNSTNGFTSNNVQGALEGLLASIEANKGNLSVAGGLEFTGATTGVDKLLADAGIQIADKGISTEKLADKAVTSDKLDGGDGDEGRVGVADAAGNITYKKIDVNNIEAKDFIAAADGDASNPSTNTTIEVLTGGENAVLVETSIRVKSESITTEHIKNATIKPQDMETGGNNKVLTTDDEGNVIWVDKLEVGEILTATNGLTKAGAALEIKLGGALTGATTITTDATNTLTLAGLQDGSAADKVMILDADDVLKSINASDLDTKTTSVAAKDTDIVIEEKIEGNNTEYTIAIKAAMPKFFYMPSMVIPTAEDQLVPGMHISHMAGVFTIDLHAVYAEQFGGTDTTSSASNIGKTTSLPVLDKGDLDYYITFFDNTVYGDVRVDNNGLLFYKVLPTADPGIGSFMNIVFAVK